MAETLNDGVMSKLAAYPGTSNDKQIAWLRAVAPIGPGTVTLMDSWRRLLVQSGYTQGSVQGRILAYMKQATGSVSNNYNDIQRLFWNT